MNKTSHHQKETNVQSNLKQVNAAKQNSMITPAYLTGNIMKLQCNPEYLNEININYLQKTIGNVAVSRLIKESCNSEIRTKSNNTGLPDNLKNNIEKLSGISMDDVNVHYNSDKPAQLQALAYTQGTDIHVKQGQEKQIPHEAWHVVQQKQGRVRPALQITGGVNVNNDPGFEKEADMMGSKVMNTSTDIGRPVISSNLTLHQTNTVQRVSDFSKFFIQNIMPIVPEMIQGIDMANYILSQDDYLKIDDSNDPPWEVAIGFLHFVFMNLIPINELENGLKSLNAIREKLSSEIVQFLSHLPNAMQVEEQIKELEDTYRFNIQIRNQETLKKIREYVSSQKTAWSQKYPQTYSDVLLSSASEMLLSPSSSSFYLDTREDHPLSHGKQSDASKYHRSARHWLFSKAKHVERMVVKRVAIKKQSKGYGGEAHVGLYPNTFTFLRNKYMPRKTKRGHNPVVEQPEDQTSAPETSPGEGDLYDASLAYKLMLSQRVAAHSQGLKHLRVGVYNDYPLVMVHFNLDDFFGKYQKAPSNQKPDDSTKEAFTSFLMNYYMGLTNYIAQSAGIDIMIVKRSSFGFNTPSVAETGESFRINMGIMPPVYANVQVNALNLLDAQLTHLLNHKAPRDKSKPHLNTSLPYFSDKQKSIDEIGDWLDFAMYPIEKRGGTSIINAVRKPESLDFVNAQSFNLMAQYGGKIASLGIIMERLFLSMTVQNGTLSTNVSSEETQYHYKVPGSEKNYKVDPEDTKQYTQLLDLIAQRVDEIAKESNDEEFKKRLQSLEPLLSVTNPHIELTLDLVNEMLLIHAMHQVQIQGDKAGLGDGYGSESEVEDSADTQKIESHDPSHSEALREGGPLSMSPQKKRFLTGKKIITHNGMRALLSSIDSAARVVFNGKKDIKVNVEGAYYEMIPALNASTIRVIMTPDIKAADILVRDINGCVTEGPKGKRDMVIDLKDSSATVWIIDTTSSTQGKMAELIEHFRETERAKILYFVSSGFKQEQFGADRNPYGTIRVFTDKSPEGRETLNGILKTIKGSDKPLAVMAHIYRRLMKRIGAVPRNKNLLFNAKSIHNPAATSGKSEDWDFSFDFTINQIHERFR